MHKANCMLSIEHISTEVDTCLNLFGTGDSLKSVMASGTVKDQ